MGSKLKVSLYVDDSFPLEKYIQKDVPKEVEVTNVYNPNIYDAIFIARTLLERFGVNSEHGVINIVDTWTFEGYKDGRLPRYYIANAIWRGELALLLAVQERMSKLIEVILAYNKLHHDSIKTFLLDSTILGGWQRHPSEQDEALDVLVKGLYKLIEDSE